MTGGTEQLIHQGVVLLRKTSNILHDPTPQNHKDLVDHILQLMDRQDKESIENFFYMNNIVSMCIEIVDQVNICNDKRLTDLLDQFYTRRPHDDFLLQHCDMVLKTLDEIRGIRPAPQRPTLIKLADDEISNINRRVKHFHDYSTWANREKLNNIIFRICLFLLPVYSLIGLEDPTKISHLVEEVMRPPFRFLRLRVDDPALKTSIIKKYYERTCTIIYCMLQNLRLPAEERTSCFHPIEQHKTKHQSATPKLQSKATILPQQLLRQQTQRDKKRRQSVQYLMKNLSSFQQNKVPDDPFLKKEWHKVKTALRPSKSKKPVIDQHLKPVVDAVLRRRTQLQTKEHQKNIELKMETMIGQLPQRIRRSKQQLRQQLDYPLVHDPQKDRNIQRRKSDNKTYADKFLSLNNVSMTIFDRALKDDISNIYLIDAENVGRARYVWQTARKQRNKLLMQDDYFLLSPDEKAIVVYVLPSLKFEFKEIFPDKDKNTIKFQVSVECFKNQARTTPCMEHIKTGSSYLMDTRNPMDDYAILTLEYQLLRLKKLYEEKRTALMSQYLQRGPHPRVQSQVKKIMSASNISVHRISGDKFGDWKIEPTYT